MSVTNNAKKSIIFNELQPEKAKELFSYSRQKFRHNIDSLYYVVKVQQDWNNDPNCIVLRDYLSNQKQKALKSFEPHVLDFLGSEFVMNGVGSKPYQYDIDKPDQFIAFVIDHQLNSKTPEIWVQLRSQFLWLYGEHEALRRSLSDISYLLEKFGITIQEVKENRIDFAYHTNYIQDFVSFFPEKDLNRMQCSRFARYSKEGVLTGEFDVESDYFTLGRKKSNNLFFRVYNKTKEVIEQGYKQFFIKLWYLEKLINYFDFYCLEKAFAIGNYRHLDVARLEFYLEYGNDSSFKKQIDSLLSARDRDYDAIASFADRLTPAITLIYNIEIETKRKFYYSFDDSIVDVLPVRSLDVPAYAARLYKIIDNKTVYHNYITCNNDNKEGVIRFIDYKAVNKNGVGWTRKKEYPNARWWIRLQQTKVNFKFDDERVDLLRTYQHDLNIVLSKRRALNAVSSYKVYLDHDDAETSTVQADILDLLSTLNETDVQKAIQYKQKKITQLANRLKDTDKADYEQSAYRLINCATGEIL